MNYIYDITLNFSRDLFDFYEWDESLGDKLWFYLKIPVFRIENSVIGDFINNEVRVDKKFLNSIYKKNEHYDDSELVSDNYSCLFVSDNMVLGIIFNEHGESYKKSTLSIDEEEDTINYSKMLKYSIIDYKIVKKNSNKKCFITRRDKLVKDKLLNSLKSIYSNKEIDKLKYVFYEVYDEKNNNEDKIYSKLVNIINNNSDKLVKIKSVFDKIINN